MCMYMLYLLSQNVKCKLKYFVKFAFDTFHRYVVFFTLTISAYFVSSLGMAKANLRPPFITAYSFLYAEKPNCKVNRKNLDLFTDY